MNNTYAVVGLGYVGLGLAVALGKKNKVIGYDINVKRIETLQQGHDYNHLIPAEELNATHVTYTHRLDDIKAANFFIVSVVTPAMYYDFPDLEPLICATKDVARVIKLGDIIVFESTVYPGTTQEVCVPLLEEFSGLKEGQDFHVGYSPERINPGDEEHTLKNTVKVIAAEDPEILAVIKMTYETVCDQTYAVSSVAAAEAVKLLENTQRDINIALMNEFSKIIHALDLDMHEILEAAKTKWSFMPYKPGFVGGHCISIDPHYLAFQAKRHGVYPDLLLTARKINDGMTQFVIQCMLKILLENKINTSQLKVGLFGISYKENVLDARNSLALKLLKELKEYGVRYQVHDPLITETKHAKLSSFEEVTELDVAIIAVGHDFYRQKGLSALVNKCKNPAVIMDISNIFSVDAKSFKDIIYWSL